MAEPSPSLYLQSVDLGGKIARWRQRRQDAKHWQEIAKAWPAQYRQPDKTPLSNQRFALGITTYLPRLEPYLKPLVQQLHAMFPDTQIIVSINGYHDEARQLAYLTEVRAWLDQFPHVEYFDFVAPQGLCTLWNGMMMRNQTERLFILNDDIQTAPFFREELEASDILNTEMTVINGSWSHLMISKATMAKAGWFDERFPGIGYEDHDYEIRMTMAELPIERRLMDSLNNLSHVPDDYSWGEDHALIFNKYSGVNGEHYEKKWDIVAEAKAGYTYVEIVKGWVALKEGMHTPDFHPNERASYE